MSTYNILAKEMEELVHSYTKKLEAQLTARFNERVRAFCANVQQQLHLNSDIYELWDGETKLEPVNELSQINMDDLSIERLSKCNVAELKALCKKNNHKVSGKKSELIDRLLGGEPVVKVKSKSTKANKATESSTVIKKLTSEILPLTVRRNGFGNFEHPETGLVFDKKTEKVIGKQMDDGTIAELSVEDIEQCKKYKCSYDLPDNLDKKSEEVEIEDLDESDEELDESESEVEIEDEEVVESEEELEEEELEEEDDLEDESD